MRLMLNILLLGVAVGLWGCQQEDKRINMAADVKSDNLAVNIVTKPVIYAFSWITGEGLEIDKAVTYINPAFSANVDATKTYVVKLRNTSADSQRPDLTAQVTFP